MNDHNGTVSVFDPGPSLPLVEGVGEARAVVWPGIGANLRSMQRFSLGERSRTVRLSHPAEAVYYVISGKGTVREIGGATHDVWTGSMFLVEPGTGYVVEAGSEGLELVGGPCPPDPALYQTL